VLGGDQPDEGGELPRIGEPRGCRLGGSEPRACAAGAGTARPPAADAGGLAGIPLGATQASTCSSAAHRFLKRSAAAVGQTTFARYAGARGSVRPTGGGGLAQRKDFRRAAALGVTQAASRAGKSNGFVLDARAVHRREVPERSRRASSTRPPVRLPPIARRLGISEGATTTVRPCRSGDATRTRRDRPQANTRWEPGVEPADQGRCPPGGPMMTKCAIVPLRLACATAIDSLNVQSDEQRLGCAMVTSGVKGPRAIPRAARTRPGWPRDRGGPYPKLLPEVILSRPQNTR
jgi:hypothetical protein